MLRINLIRVTRLLEIVEICRNFSIEFSTSETEKCDKTFIWLFDECDLDLGLKIVVRSTFFFSDSVTLDIFQATIRNHEKVENFLSGVYFCTVTFGCWRAI